MGEKSVMDLSMNKLQFNSIKLLLLTLTLTACVTNKDDLIPIPDTSLEDIYIEAGEEDVSVNRNAHSIYVEVDKPKTAHPLDKEFKEISNPTLYMYVAPHYTSGGVPIPGYTTKFKMYDRTNYAAEGEK